MSTSKFPFLNAFRASAKQGAHLWSSWRRPKGTKTPYFLCFSSRPKHASCLQNYVRAPFGNIFLCSVILPNPPSFISSFARLVSGFTQSSGWNTHLAWSACVLLSKMEIACLTLNDVRPAELWSSTFLVPGTDFVGDTFSMDWGWGGGFGMVQVHYIHCALLLVSH